MPANQAAILLWHVRRILGPRLDACGNGTLLERFAQDADEAAFAVLVERHGQLVWNVSRRVARHEQDAEDVYQATYLLSARKAPAIRNNNSAGSWLCGVAHRLALRTRCDMARQRQRDRQAQIDHGRVTSPSPNPETGSSATNATVDDVTWRELREVLDDELARLPDKYRSPLLLCYFEGLTQAEAARQLAWSKRSVKDRLERGRHRLRARLAKRGVTLAMTLAGSMLAGGIPPAAAPAVLTEATMRAATLRALHRPLSGVASVGALALAEGGLKTMWVSKLRNVAVAIAVTMLLGGAGWLLGQAAWDPIPEAVVQERGGDKESSDRYGDPLPPGAVIRLGTVRFRITCLATAFLPEGKTVVSAEQGGSIKLWDPRTGRLVREFDTGHFKVSGGGNGGFALSRDAEPALRAVLAEKPSPELRRRAESLLAQVDASRSPTQMRGVRGVEFLEYLGGPEARQVLQKLADGAPEARLTREAKAALQRLDRR